MSRNSVSQQNIRAPKISTKNFAHWTQIVIHMCFIVSIYEQQFSLWTQSELFFCKDDVYVDDLHILGSAVKKAISEICTLGNWIYVQNISKPNSL